MKVGIIVYSYTGNTLMVAKKLQESLSVNNSVYIEKIYSENDKEIDLKKIVLKHNPDLTKYDVLVFASPVNGFTLAPVMKVYLEQISSITSKPVYTFVTMFFPFNWMGGNNAIKVMKDYVEEKEAEYKDFAIIHWKSKKRDNQISDFITMVSNNINK